MGTQGSGAVTAVELLARLEALTARLDEQAATIAEQAEEIARLKRPAPSTGAPLDVEPAAGTTSRRRLLTSALAAGAAVSALAVSKAAPASANDPNDIPKDGGAYTNAGTGLACLSSTVLCSYVFFANNASNAGIALPAAKIGLAGHVSGVDNTTQPRFGVYGATDGGSGSAGLRGAGTSSTGVWGTSSTQYGVLGQSNTGAGVFGDSNAAGGYGVFGRSTSGAAIFGTTTNGYAASFNGPVVVQGSFTVTGGPKSAAVKHPDGSMRRVYCQEATEAWFEDFGTGQLQNGSATIVLDPDFEAVVRGDDYLVFMTPEGACNGLFVSKKGPRQFVVEEINKGQSSIPFSYRVVSRRRDNVGKRLEKVDLRTVTPSITLPPPPDPVGPRTTPAGPKRQ